MAIACEGSAPRSGFNSAQVESAAEASSKADRTSQRSLRPICLAAAPAKADSVCTGAAYHHVRIGCHCANRRRVRETGSDVRRPRCRGSARALAPDQFAVVRHVLAVFGAETARGYGDPPAATWTSAPAAREDGTMELRMMFGPARSLRWAATGMAAASFVLGGAMWAGAQQPPTPVAPPQAAPAKPAAKPQAKKPATTAPAAQSAPAQPAPPAQAPVQQTQGAAPAQQLPLVYSPWTKICGKDQQPNAKEVCLVIKEARLERGQFVAGAVLVEPEGDPKKMLRVTLPLGMQLQQGTRVIIDQGNPVARPYVICFPNGCMSDYDADLDLVGKLKKGQGLIVQA